MDEKKSKDKKIKELEKAVKIRINDEKVVEIKKPVLKCKDCNFETTSKRGLNVHIRRRHSNFKEQEYPSECDFCDSILDSEKELKMHLKTCHTLRETNYVCEDCDSIGDNEYLGGGGGGKKTKSWILN